MNQESSAVRPRFQGQVLNKLYRVWLFRKLLPVLIAEIIVFAFFLYEIGERVFIERVFDNASNILFTHPSGIPSFFVSAFLHAPKRTEAVVVIAALALAFLIRHFTQGILRLILVRQNYFGKIQNQGAK